MIYDSQKGLISFFGFNLFLDIVVFMMTACCKYYFCNVYACHNAETRNKDTTSIRVDRINLNVTIYWGQFVASTNWVAVQHLDMCQVKSSFPWLPHFGLLSGAQFIRNLWVSRVHWTADIDIIFIQHKYKWWRCGERAPRPGRADWWRFGAWHLIGK